MQAIDDSHPASRVAAAKKVKEKEYPPWHENPNVIEHFQLQNALYEQDPKTGQVRLRRPKTRGKAARKAEKRALRRARVARKRA